LNYCNVIRILGDERQPTPSRNSLERTQADLSTVFIFLTFEEARSTGICSLNVATMVVLIIIQGAVNP
jgi:hypothetical protein